MLLLIEDLLELVGKIEFVLYPPGAGGDYWSSLIAVTYNSNKPFMSIYKGNQIRYTAYGRKGNLAVKAPAYQANLANNIGGITNSVYHYDFDVVLAYKTTILSNLNVYLRTHMDSALVRNVTRINTVNIEPGAIKYQHLQATLLYIQPYLKDLILIFPNHFMAINYPWPKASVEAVVNESSWTTLNLMPKTQEGFKFFKKRHLALWGFDYTTDYYRDQYATGDKFWSYYDYIIHEDYKSIMNFIESHYGSNFDWDRVEKELKIYYKKAVKPVLDA